MLHLVPSIGSPQQSGRMSWDRKHGSIGTVLSTMDSNKEDAADASGCSSTTKRIYSLVRAREEIEDGAAF